MNIETISIRSTGVEVVLEIAEADGNLVELCRERLDAAFSHAVHSQTWNTRHPSPDAGEVEGSVVERAKAIEMLALRAYPGFNPSGFCSQHQGGDPTFVCGICFPDLNGLITAHCDLKQKAWADNDRLKQALKDLVEAIEANKPDDDDAPYPADYLAEVTAAKAVLK